MKPAVVRLGNDIARQFATRCAEEAAQQIAEHIRSFWEPGMIAQLRAVAASPQAEELDPLVRQAIAHLT
ncbi:MAG: formate dehydrogenase subunit delta [Nostocoides sp.]